MFKKNFILSYLKNPVLERNNGETCVAVYKYVWDYLFAIFENTKKCGHSLLILMSIGIRMHNFKQVIFDMIRIDRYCINNATILYMEMWSTIGNIINQQCNIIAIFL